MIENLSLVIQAGGKSSRMGSDKALKPFLGQALVQRVVDRLAHLAGEVIVTTNHPEAYASLHLRTAADPFPGRGTLGGMYTALACASLPFVAVVACDLPFASAAMFTSMVEILEGEAVDAVVPRSDGGLEPLHAVYRRETCLPAVRHAVEAGELKTIDWFPRVRLREFTLDEAIECDPSGLAFWNINTPQEFEEAERVAGEMG
jgi:molybdopterin-guanine dinucleotide biosynthesis protein A